MTKIIILFSQIFITCCCILEKEKKFLIEINQLYTIVNNIEKNYKTKKIQYNVQTAKENIAIILRILNEYEVLILKNKIIK